MAMTKREALEVIQFVRDVFNIDFDKNKGTAWLNLLTERGDYEKTMRNAKNRASDGNKFRPTISEIIITSSNVSEAVIKDVDETETHAYKKRYDENYAKVMSDMEKLRNRLVSEVQDDE